MDSGTAPVITLTGSKWGSQTGGTWSQTTAVNDTYIATFDHNGTEEYIPAEVASVANASGAKDLSGNDEIGDDSPSFVVDTLKPTVSDVTPTSLADADEGSLTVDITFSEDMTQTDILTVTEAIVDSP